LGEPSAIVISLAGDDPSCGLSDGSITVTASGGTGTLEFSLDGVTFQASNIFSALTGGGYTVTVRDANGCTEDESITLTEEVSTIVASATGTDPLCNGGADGSIEVTASGGTGTLEYSLDGLTYQASNIFSGLTAGAYTVTVQDDNGCTSTADVTLNDPALITASANVTEPTCNGDTDGEIEVTAAGGTGTLEYSLDGVTFQASNVFTDLAAGDYTITIRDANACTATLDVTVGQPDVLTAESFLVIDPLCDGINTGSIGVDADGGTFPYTYSIDGGAPQFIPLFLFLGVGDHIIEVTDGNGCTFSYTETLSPFYTPELTVDAVQEPLCNGDANGTITVTIGGSLPNYSYTINGVEVSSDNSDATFTFTGLAAGTYVVQASGLLGCNTSEITIELGQPEVLTASGTVTDATTPSSADGSIDVDALGGTEPYEYSTDGVTFQASDVLSGLVAGDYTVTVRDANGCTTTFDATVSFLACENPPVLGINVFNSICGGGRIEAAAVVEYGDDTPYEYRLMDEFGAPLTAYQTNGIFQNLAPGLYMVEVRNPEEVVCSTIREATVTGIPGPTRLTIVASSIRSNAASATWPAISGVTMWRLEYRVAGSQNAWTVRDGLTTTLYSMTGLQPSTTYEVRLYAMCDGIPSEGFATAGFTTLAGSGCAVPGNLRAVAATENSLTLAWNAVSVSNIRVQYRKAGTLSWISLPLLAGTETGVMLVNLTANTQYQFRLQSICSGSSSPFGVAESAYTLPIGGREAAADTDVTETSAMSLYPNPNNGSFTLAILSADQATSQLIVTDLNGRTIHRQTSVVEAGMTELPITLNNVSAGVYVISCTLNGEVTTTKMVVR